MVEDLRGRRTGHGTLWGQLEWCHTGLTGIGDAKVGAKVDEARAEAWVSAVRSMRAKGELTLEEEDVELLVEGEACRVGAEDGVVCVVRSPQGGGRRDGGHGRGDQRGGESMNGRGGREDERRCNEMLLT